MSSEERAPSRLWVWLLILLSAAILIRATYALEMGQSFEFRRHEWRQTDMRFFRDWARQISAGDWLSRQVTVPRHSWLIRVQTRDEWKHWLQKRFYQAPAYPYLLAVFLSWSNSLWPFVLFQMLLGVGSVALTFLLGRRLFSWRVGLLAAIAVTLYGPLLYLEPMLLRSTLITFLGLWLLWLALQVRDRPSWWRWTGLGLVMGLAVLCKATFALALPLTLWIAWPRQTSPASSSRLLSGAALLLGLGLVLTPLLLRNIAVGAKPWALSANGSLVFVQGNAPDGKPYPHFSSRFFREVFTKTQGKLWPTIRETLAQHSVFSFLSLHMQRLWVVLRKEEVPNNACYALARKRSQILSLLWVDMLLLVPFGLLGMFLSLRGAAAERRAGWLLLGLLGLHALSWLWGGYLMRYRVPIVPLLAIFSAFFLNQLLDWSRAKQWQPVVLSVLSAVLLAGVIHLPVQRRPVEIRFADYMAPIYHDMELARFQETCDVATIAARAHPKRYKPYQTLMCGCQRVYQQCENQNCLARVWTQCKKRFTRLLKEERKRRKKRKAAHSPH